MEGDDTGGARRHAAAGAAGRSVGVRINLALGHPVLFWYTRHRHTFLTDQKKAMPTKRARAAMDPSHMLQWLDRNASPNGGGVITHTHA